MGARGKILRKGHKPLTLATQIATRFGVPFDIGDAQSKKTHYKGFSYNLGCDLGYDNCRNKTLWTNPERRFVEP